MHSEQITTVVDVVVEDSSDGGAIEDVVETMQVKQVSSEGDIELIDVGVTETDVELESVGKQLKHISGDDGFINVDVEEASNEVDSKQFEQTSEDEVDDKTVLVVKVLIENVVITAQLKH